MTLVLIAKKDGPAGTARHTAGAPRGKRGKVRQPYTAPTPEQLAASRARRQAQAKAKANRPNVRHRTGQPFGLKRTYLKPLGNKGLAGLAVGSGGLYAVHAVNKADNADRARNVVVGGVAGGALGGFASDVGGQALKAQLKRRRWKRGESAKDAQVWSSHLHRHGLMGKLTPKTPEKTKKQVFRSYPKELPDWRAHRLLANKNPRLIVATGTGAGAAYGATRVRKAAPPSAKLDERRRKEVAGAAAGGAGAGYLAAPGRRINRGGRYVSPEMRRLPEGVHNVDPKTLTRYAQGTGFRFGDRAHVAQTAQKIQREGYDPKRPVGVTVWNDRAMITDGNHRVFGTAVAGQKSVPVQIRRGKGHSPADQARAAQIYDYARGTAQRKQYKRAIREGQPWIDRNAKKAVKPGSWQDKVNSKLANLGAGKAPRAAKVISNRSYYGRNAAMIGGGAAAVGGTKYLYEKGKVQRRAAVPSPVARTRARLEGRSGVRKSAGEAMIGRGRA